MPGRRERRAWPSVRRAPAASTTRWRCRCRSRARCAAAWSVPADADAAALEKLALRRRQGPGADRGQDGAQGRSSCPGKHRSTSWPTECARYRPCRLAVVLGACACLSALRLRRSKPRTRAAARRARRHAAGRAAQRRSRSSCTARRASTTTPGCARRTRRRCSRYLRGGERLHRGGHAADRRRSQSTLYEEMLGRIQQTDLTRPVPRRRLLLLLAHRGGQAVPDLLPQARAAWTRPRR